MKHNRSRVRHFSDTFQLFEAGDTVVQRLITTCPEFAHLTRAKLPSILSQRALVERGRACAGVVLEPQSGVTSSARRNLIDWLLVEFVRERCDGYEPDYLLMFDTALWPTKDTHAAEHLAYHLLCHIEQKLDAYGSPVFHDDGRAQLRQRSHDVERFNVEIARYGSTIQDIQDEHGTYAQARGKAAGLYRIGREPGHGRKRA